MGVCLASNRPPAVCGPELSFLLHKGLRVGVLHTRQEGPRESMNGNRGLTWINNRRHSMETTRGEIEGIYLLGMIWKKYPDTLYHGPHFFRPGKS